MIPYIAAYQMACKYSRKCLSPFELPKAWEHQYTAKAGNLAMCFLGFAGRRGWKYWNRSAELGVLGSTFDLVSDGLGFEALAVRRFEYLAQRILDPESARISLETLERKKIGSFGRDGLSRGIPALRIILKHLQSEEFWPHENEVVEVGVLCQIVDDLIDYRNDIAKNELNFLRHENWTFQAKRLLEWNYKEQFQNSQYPLVLFLAFRRAKARAAKLVNGAFVDVCSESSSLGTLN